MVLRGLILCVLLGERVWTRKPEGQRESEMLGRDEAAKAHLALEVSSWKVAKASAKTQARG